MNSLPILIAIITMQLNRKGGGHKYNVGIALTLIGILITRQYILDKPDIELKLTEDTHFKHVNVEMKKINYPNITKITHINIDCLRKKGYEIDSYPFLYSDFISKLIIYDQNYSKLPHRQKLIEFHSKLSYRQKLIENCKECNIYTEIVYNYKNMFGVNINKKKNIYWHKCHENKLE